jgi:hypothetical protein
VRRVCVRVVRVDVSGSGGPCGDGHGHGCRQDWRRRRGSRLRRRCRYAYNPVAFWEGREIRSVDGGTVPRIGSAKSAAAPSKGTETASAVLVVLRG